MNGCANKFWVEDLLLVRRDFLQEFIRDHGEVTEVNWEYQIQVMEKQDYEIYDIKKVFPSSWKNRNDKVI